MFAEALANGESSFGTATSVAAMQAVVRNTMVQGILSVLFVVLAIIVILSAVIASWRSWKSRELSTSEDRAVPSRLFGPASFIPTRAERAIQKQWDARPKQRTTRGSKKAGH